jgi:carbamoyl-phosphate synthase large subunit
MTVVEVSEAREMAERIASKLGLKGPLNVQFFITEGSPLIIELNPRFSGTTPVRTAVGFKEVDAILSNFLFDEELPLRFKRGVIAIRYLDEVYSSLSALSELQEQMYTDTKGWRKRYF